MIGLDPGAYRLVGAKPGYIETFYAARRHASEGAILRLDAAQPLAEVTLKLAPAGVIAGRALDPDGEPAAGTHVVLARQSRWMGRPRLEAIDSADANDEGGYRFSGLAPGRYNVLVEPKTIGWDREDHSPVGAGPREAVVPTFYPGVPDAEMATAIELRGGERREGIDVTQARSRVFRVRGRVVNAPAGGTAVSLRSLRDRIHDFDPHTITRNAAGEFEFRNVPPGAYVAVAKSASAAIEVGFGDVEGVRLPFGQAAEMKARVSAEGDERPRLGNFSMFVTQDGRSGHMWNFDQEGMMTDQIGPGIAAPNGIEAGTYDVVFAQVPKGYYVKSARCGERDVLAERLSVPSSGTVPVDVMLASDGGRVEGAVTDREGRTAAGATVVLVPDPPLRARADRFRSVTTDQYGHYGFEAVPPGEYTLFAWDDADESDWTDPQFLEKHEKEGSRLTVIARENSAVRAKMIAVIR
jgi:hypothetical protein